MSSYQVLYRKYRPRDFSEVVGQDQIVRVLQRQIETGRVAHAYLFSGPRGIGKTTTARLIAKAANCTLRDREGHDVAVWKAHDRDQKLGGHEQFKVTKKDSERPCNRCESCLAFNAGSALNLIEIDAASNRGIDEIRELREAVRFAPPEGGKKVYIIDECHQLTREAANAILKTLEEPPAHAVFILATTEIDKVPETIVSRTQHFEFRRPRQAVIRDRLLALAGYEGVSLEPDAADAIAFAAEGSVRDAESMLGKIMAVEDNSITHTEVEEILGIPRREAITELISFIGARRLREAVELINRLYHDGHEMEYLAKILVGFLRDALLRKIESPVARDAAEGSDGGEDAALDERLNAFPADALADAIVALIDAIPAIKRSPIPQLPLELALMKITASRGEK